MSNIHEKFYLHIYKDGTQRLFQKKRSDSDIEYIRSDKSGWIPVTERLPEMGKRVLVFTDFDVMHTAILRPDGWDCEPLKFFETGIPEDDEHPTHWRELPEPPKGKQQ